MFEDYYPIPPSPGHPNRYASIHALYGPGAYLAWLLTAYSVWIQTFTPYDHNHPQIRKTHLDKNLLLTLTSSLFASGHLVYQIVHYPGPRNELWTTTDEDLIPFVTAIYASAQFCITALGVQIVLLGFFYKSRAHQRIVGAASICTALSLLFTCFYVPQQRWTHFRRGTTSVLLSILIFPSTFAIAWNALIFLMMVVGKAVLTLQALAEFRLWRVVKGVLWCGVLVPCIMVGFYPMVQGVGTGNVMLWPKSEHTVMGEMGQWLVLGVAGVNFGASVWRVAWRQIGVVRKDLHKTIGWGFLERGGS